jgi:hypothetical protein
LCGLSKFFLDFTNKKTKRVRPDEPQSNPEPMTLESLQKLTDPASQGDWVYHPPQAKQ